MKIKEVASLARESGSVTLVNEREAGQITRQWLMIGGCAVYPLDGLPLLDENTLMYLLDVPAKQRDGFRVFTTDVNETIERFLFDYAENDVNALISQAEICWDGQKILCVYAGYGEELFVDAKWLKPLSDAKKELTYTIRRYKKGEKAAMFLVVHNGMLNVGAITCGNVWVTDRAALEIERMSNCAARAAKENRERLENAEK